MALIFARRNIVEFVHGNQPIVKRLHTKLFNGKAECGMKPHKLVIIAIARRLVTIANAIIKTGIPWQHQPTT